jgi:hypothetical protein
VGETREKKVPPRHAGSLTNTAQKENSQGSPSSEMTEFESTSVRHVNMHDSTLLPRKDTDQRAHKSHNCCPRKLVVFH